MDAADRALLDLCALVATDPGRVIGPSRNPVGRGIRLATHAHPTWLQFDLALGCAGHWLVAGRRVGADAGAIALVFAPGVAHGYEIAAATRGAEICNFKLAVPARWPAARVFPAIARGVGGSEPLAAAMRRLARLGAAGGATPALVAATVEILCLWPRLAGGVGAAPAATLDPRIEAAMAAIEERLDRPLRLAEAARRAGLSPRHLARRFAAACGCTPRAWAEARRVARARELLAQGRLSITATAEAVGFGSVHAFSRWFHRAAGVTPSAFRERPTGF